MEEKKMNLKARIYNIFRSTIKSSTCTFTAKDRTDSVELPTFIPSSFSNRHRVTESNLILHRSLSLPTFSDSRNQHQPIFSDPNTSKKKKNGRTKLPSNPYGFTTPSFSEVGSDENDNDEKEEETETLFSSDSSDLYYSRKKPPSRPPRRGTDRRHRRKFRQIKKNRKKGEGWLGGGGDVVAVVVETKDRYEDFRVSMVEMIVEKKMFGEKELGDLLQCYLSLNSPDHHSTILTAFSDICEVLFG